jgi:hypothetical protein
MPCHVEVFGPHKEYCIIELPLILTGYVTLGLPMFEGELLNMYNVKYKKLENRLWVENYLLRFSSQNAEKIKFYV